MSFFVLLLLLLEKVVEKVLLGVCGHFGLIEMEELSGFGDGCGIWIK